ncbi:hypothetical protein [Paraburkholderia humisilvae]|uniref:Uncharacterized protein n=1 Tax=Paraburkholderia humisilvae TaxID=627669 RepID=A0A6J5EWJ3_9BURK|nr:hypothetical protein [Paraburkholderia humisilvae]CAB3770543.1 hypothetical protein LMG29542_06387 [Paraburkholderia humisilvae]
MPLISSARKWGFRIGGTMEVSGWDQLVRLWELIVLVCKFLWGLLRLLGGL